MSDLVEHSFDGGKTWVRIGVFSNEPGALMPIWEEPPPGVIYRVTRLSDEHEITVTRRRTDNEPMDKIVAIPGAPPEPCPRCAVNMVADSMPSYVCPHCMIRIPVILNEAWLKALHDAGAGYGTILIRQS